MQVSETLDSAQTRNAIKPVKKKSGAVWERVQLYGSATLTSLITLTLLFLFIIALPTVLGHKTASPVIPNQAELNFAILMIHIVTAIPPLGIGMFAFSKRIRNASIRIHRWIGTTYCVSIWISAVTGVMLAMANQNGILAQMGFSGLGISWFVTTYLAYRTARAKNIVSHRRWMIRSYALTLAVVTIRPIFILPPPFHLDPMVWYTMATWLCWVPNLLLGELYIRVTKPNGKLKQSLTA